MINFIESCPFCGGGFIALTKPDVDTGESHCFCEDCESAGPSAFTAEGSILVWNERAPSGGQTK